MEPMPAMQDRIHRTQSRILGFLRRRVPDAAEELSQEVWLRVARAEPDCASDAEFAAYAFAVARRLIIDHHRRRAARVVLVPLEGGTDRHSDGDGDPHANACATEVLLAVESTLADMKPEMSEVFRWRTTDDVSFKEIARRQGVGINTALGRMHSAVKKIRTALVAQDLMPEGGRA